METQYYVGVVKEGTITHEDQTVNGLTIEMVASSILRITGDPSAITSWQQRTQFVAVTESEALEAVRKIKEAVGTRESRRQR